MKFNVRKKLMLSHGVIVFFVILVGLLGISSLTGLNKEVKTLNDHWITGVYYIEEFGRGASEYRNTEWLYLNSTSEERQKIEHQFTDRLNQYTESWNLYKGTMSTDLKEKELVQIIDEARATYQSYHQQLLNLSKQNSSLPELEVVMNESHEPYLAFQKAVNDLVVYNNNHADESVKNAESVYNRSRVLDIIAIVVSILIGAFVTIFMNRLIQRPLALVERELNALSSGDITRDTLVIKQSDEIGSLAGAYNLLHVSLKTLLTSIKSTVTELSQMSSVLANQTEQTSANITSNAATMNELSTTVENITQNFITISDDARKASDEANNGHEGLNEINRQMNFISDSTKVIASSIVSLNQKANEIGQIVELITDIADQTNLLALNAAIEAARAGDAGRGFSVVADEVRKLAEKANNASKQIRGLIGDIQNDVHVANDSVALGGKEVDSGLQQVKDIALKFESIIQSAEHLSENLHDVASATEEMSAGVQSIAASTEEQSASAQEVAASSESLAKIAFNLDELVGKFRIN